MTPEFAISRITSDMEIGRRLWLQLCDLKDAILIDQKAKEELSLCVVEVMRKLETVKYHRDNVIRIVAEELETRREAAEKSSVIVADRTTGAEKEFEAFLMQGKACLDVLVKVLRPLLGVKLHSYGEGGKKVGKAIRGNLGATELPRADLLLQLVDHACDWAQQWFASYRDTITHYRSLASSGFVGVPDGTGRLQHFPPSDPSGLPLHELVQLIYTDLLSFCEDFLVFSVQSKFPPGIGLGLIPEDRRDKDHPRKYGMFMIGVKT